MARNAGSLWAGSATGLFHLTRQGMTRWALPAEAVGRGGVQSLVVGKDGVVWVSLVRSGLYRFAGGAWQHFDTAMMGKDATPIFLYVNKAGRVFMGFTKNRIGELVGGVLRALPTSAVDIGHVLSLLEVDGHLLAGGELGMAWVGPQGSRAFQPEQMKALLGVSGLALDRRGDLWAHGADGVFHITRDELARFWAQPQQPLKWEVFNLTDGVRGNAAQIRPLPSLVAGNDGRVFYATNTQVGWIDPLHVRRNALAPHVMVQSIRAGDRQFQPRGVLRLAPGTTAVEIRYAATALSIPEKVKIRYKLSGVDSGWQEPGGERIARYTNLAPGQYVFQVIAANEDGVWNNQGATQQIEILPQLWQTTWFRAAVAALVLLAALALHRWRIAAVEARSAERLAARLDERERIARNLHDNLLQGVYALILRCSTILKRLPPESQEKRILEEALDRADRLIDHTRDEVMGLRDNQSASQAVAALRDQLAAMEPLLQGRLTLRVSDGVERIRPYVACEICQVIKEAVVNAARHSGASAIAATLEVRAGGIVVAIVDNGVGIAADVAEAGVAGHWGIVGMRERVAALSGVLSIGREGERGTAVRFSVSAASGFS
ncbi:triple tyrosine motif-containing protein [Duganella sp. P38]|uniref:sensor histidine kinase n=1 Tax=Duganella sp. P38 TaxID=3423949 RepID=UPI003D799D54